MDRKFYSFTPKDTQLFKQKLLNFGSGFSNFCFLDSNGYSAHSRLEAIAGIGQTKQFSLPHSELSKLPSFLTESHDYVFGHFAYDLKNKFEKLQSGQFDGIGFPDLHLFVPQTVIEFSREQVYIGTFSAEQARKIFRTIEDLVPAEASGSSIELKGRFDKKEYFAAVNHLLDHIAIGDCFEACFCQEFYAENQVIHPPSVFQKLNAGSPNPFAAFYKLNDRYLFCASPERFLAKRGKEIISQPIKGTLKRTGLNEQSDLEESTTLLQDGKERAENIMIVDLVRNDLSRICEPGSVHVSEYLKVYSYPKVHQMISTISGVIPTDVSFDKILSATFPMGSMTGAPKVKVMKLLEKYERTRRGLFSGSVGYFDPRGDFDFNVVIRSVLYNAESNYLSVQAGSAITAKSIAEKEYEECLLKISAITDALR